MKILIPESEGVRRGPRTERWGDDLMHAWGQWLFQRPPLSVTLAARRAFRERRIPPAPCVDLVFDSSLDMPEPMRPAHRVLMLHGEGFDIVLTVTRHERQCHLAGTVITPNGAVRPLSSASVPATDLDPVHK